MRQFIY